MMKWIEPGNDRAPLTAILKAVCKSRGSSWCEKHQRDRYHGEWSCRRLHERLPGPPMRFEDYDPESAAVLAAMEADPDDGPIAGGDHAAM